jgi:3-oxoacyl-[acyl-carrier protein] reductase
MDLGLEGKVAMVAAASKGIGLATAKLLAQEGCQISICARDEETLELAAGEIAPETRSYVVDVAIQEDLDFWVTHTEEDLGPVDILVTNTGGPPAGRLGEIDEEQWRHGIDTTLLNVVRLVEHVTPAMEQRGWGRIVHVSSLVAKQPAEGLVISSTIRAGLLALTRLQAVRSAAHGVTVNTVLPGHTYTDRQLHLAALRAKELGITEEEALERQAKEIPMGRLATPEEIAAAIVFLCSTQASYITGTSLLVDGGVVRGV